MALVNVTNVLIRDNPAPFTNPFQFEITFECIQDLTEDLEWKVIYVGSSESKEYDQTLEQVLVGPVTMGCHQFVLQADPPDPTTLQEVLGVTVVLIVCSYQNHEFVRIGYYVNNEYDHRGDDNDDYRQAEDGRDLQQLQQQNQWEQQGNDCGLTMDVIDNNNNNNTTDDEMLELQSTMDYTKIIRTILADKPRVTRFTIPWQCPQQEQQQLYVPFFPSLLQQEQQHGDGDDDDDDDYLDIDDSVHNDSIMVTMSTLSPQHVVKEENAWISTRVVSPTMDFE